MRCATESYRLSSPVSKAAPGSFGELFRSRYRPKSNDDPKAISRPSWSSCASVYFAARGPRSSLISERSCFAFEGLGRLDFLRRMASRYASNRSPEKGVVYVAGVIVSAAAKDLADRRSPHQHIRRLEPCRYAPRLRTERRTRASYRDRPRTLKALLQKLTDSLTANSAVSFEMTSVSAYPVHSKTTLRAALKGDELTSGDYQ